MLLISPTTGWTPPPVCDAKVATGVTIHFGSPSHFYDKFRVPTRVCTRIASLSVNPVLTGTKRTRRRNLPPITQRSQRHFASSVHTPHEAVTWRRSRARCDVSSSSLTFARIHESNRVRSGVLVDPPIVKKRRRRRRRRINVLGLATLAPDDEVVASTRNPMDVTSTLRALTRSAKSSRAGARRPAPSMPYAMRGFGINITLRRRADFTSPETVLALIETASWGEPPVVPSSGIVEESRPEIDVASTSTSSPRATETATLPETVRTEMSEGTSTDKRTLPEAVRIS